MAKKQYRIINKGKGILNISETDLHKIQNTTIVSGIFDNQNGTIRFTNNESEEFLVSGITIPEIPELEGYSESGTRAGGDLVTTMGDYDDSGNGSKIIVDDAEGYVNLDSDIIRLGKNISGTTTNTTYVNNLNIQETPELIENINNLVLARNSDGTISEVNIDSYYRATHSELKTLKDNNELIPYKKYVLTDYQHKYIINGSDSGDVKQTYTTIGQAANYVQFTSVDPELGGVGVVATVVSVPTGATVSVGDEFTVTEFFNSSYIKFSPTSLINSNNFGVGLEFKKQRYSNIPSNAVINDSNGKPVMKPNGVLNTDVHDGGPYMDMTGAENPTPIVEEILLTAISNNQFSRDCESLTFENDILVYSFGSTTISNENGIVISGLTRPGLIFRRSNSSLVIDVNKDWRNQRYRRYKVDADNWSNMTFTSTNAPLYTVGGRNYATYVNTINEEHKYLLRTPKESKFYLDFYSSGNTDVFLSGETASNTLEMFSNSRANIPSSSNNPYLRDVVLPISGVTKAKDFHIFPITDYKPKSIVGNFEVKWLSNSVFRDLNQRYGISGGISMIKLGDNSLVYDCTFNTTTYIYNSGNLRNIKSIDRFGGFNHGTVDNLFNLQYTYLKNEGLLYYSRFSGYRDNTANNSLSIDIDHNSSISNLIIGSARFEAASFNSAMIRGLVILNKFTSTVNINGSIYMNSIIGHNVDIYATNFILNNFNRKSMSKTLFGTKHIITSSLNNIIIDDNNTKGVLLTRNTDGDNFTTSITQIGTTQ